MINRKQQLTKMPSSKKIIPVLLTVSLLAPQFLAGGLSASAQLPMNIDTSVRTSIDLTSPVVRVAANTSNFDPEKTTENDIEANIAGTNKVEPTGEVFVNESRESWMPIFLFHPFFDYYKKLYFHSQFKKADSTLTTEAKTNTTVQMKQKRTDQIVKSEATAKANTTAQTKQKGNIDATDESKRITIVDDEVTHPVLQEDSKQPDDVSDTEFRPLNIDAKLWLNSEVVNLHLTTKTK